MTSYFLECSVPYSIKFNLLPNKEGKTKAAGPGPWNSAAIGPLLLVGVQDPLCPPIVTLIEVKLGYRLCNALYWPLDSLFSVHCLV